MPPRGITQHQDLDYLPLIAIGLCYLAITMMWTLYSAYVPVFLSLDYGLRAAVIGLVMTLDNVAAIFVQPWIGARSDRLRTRLGRRLPIILLATPFAAIGFALVPSAAELFQGLWGFFMVLVVMLVAMAAIRVPLFALMPDLTPPERRSTANGVLNLFGGLGTLIAALALSGLYRAHRAIPFWLTGFTLTIAVLILWLVIWQRAPEQLRPDPPPSEREEVEAADNVLEMLRQLLAHSWRGAPLLLLAILVYTVGFNGIETFFSLYGRNQLHIPEERALLLLGLFFIAYLLASVPAGLLGERAGRRRTMIFGLLALSFCLGTAYLVGTLQFLILAMPLGGVAWAMVNSNAIPAVVDRALPGFAGSAIGLFYASTTLASIVSPLANGWLVDRAGGDYSLIVLTASCAAALGAFCLVFALPPSRLGEPQ